LLPLKGNWCKKFLLICFAVLCGSLCAGCAPKKHARGSVFYDLQNQFQCHSAGQKQDELLQSLAPKSLEAGKIRKFRKVADELCMSYKVQLEHELRTGRTAPSEELMSQFEAFCRATDIFCNYYLKVLVRHRSEVHFKHAHKEYCCRCNQYDVAQEKVHLSRQYYEFGLLTPGEKKEILKEINCSIDKLKKSLDGQ